MTAYHDRPLNLPMGNGPDVSGPFLFSDHAMPAFADAGTDVYVRFLEVPLSYPAIL